MTKMLLIIVIANAIVPILALQNLQSIFKNLTVRTLDISNATQRQIDEKLENMFSNVTYELFMNWTTKEDLVNNDILALFYTPEFLCNFEPDKKYLDKYYDDQSLYTAKRRCGIPHCEQFKKELDKRDLCKDEPNMNTKLNGTIFEVVVDTENVRCLTIQSERKEFVNVFKKNPKVCLCTYIVNLHSSLVAYIVYEDVDNKGVYHYTRLKDNPHNIIPEERARHFKDKKLKITVRTFLTFDAKILKQYKELFLMEETFESTCKKGAFKLVGKERYKGPADKPETVIPRGAGLENVASSSNSYSVPSSPLRAPPSPTSFTSTPSSP
uniref:Uncharacterized protein n=1 Tax=Cacopsylla melanoneura TaxID=428564 RepID=A0A8D8Z425_9HEMI